MSRHRIGWMVLRSRWTRRGTCGLTRDLDVSAFVMFSSMASWSDRPGQASYAAANSFWMRWPPTGGMGCGHLRAGVCGIRPAPRPTATVDFNASPATASWRCRLLTPCNCSIPQSSTSRLLPARIDFAALKVKFDGGTLRHHDVRRSDQRADRAPGQ